MIVRVSTIQELEKVTDVLTQHINEGYRIVLLYGELGSGKTTLVKALCETLWVAEPVSSPTFSLINEYDSAVQGLMYHMALYRLEKPDDLNQIGLEEYLYSGHLCLIEWPEIAEEHIIMAHIRVKIDVENHDIRIFNITTHDAVDA
jgi:tRNA threonylcarbamoyladenosine biosynthesis protein TsaE